MYSKVVCRVPAISAIYVITVPCKIDYALLRFHYFGHAESNNTVGSKHIDDRLNVYFVNYICIIY